MKKTPKEFAIASCTMEATQAGIEIASSGGNAVDAAVGSALDLIVSNILMTSIAGGGFATVRIPDGTVETIDFFDCMPGKGLDMQDIRKTIKPVKIYLEYGTGIDVLIGHATAGVPGNIKGLELLLKRYGTMPLKEVLQPAIKHAKEGTKISKSMGYWLDLSSKKLHWHTDYCKKLLSTPIGEILDAGYLLKQHDLCKTLEMIAQYGSDVVYKGEIADAIVKEMKSNGGLITHEDLKTYEAIVRKPIETIYRGKKVYTNPPPSVGGATLIELLNIISNIKLENKLTPDIAITLGKAIRLALHDKFTRYLDIETNEEVSKELLSLEYALKCYKKIQPSANTTHLSCADNSGYGVSITMSMGYGSGVAIPNTGIIMDNALGEMELNPKGYLNATPGQRLISGMAPSIIYDELNNDMLVLGTPGASRIAPCLMQVISNIVDYKMDLCSAVSASRLHFEDNKFAYESGIELNSNLLDSNVEICSFDDLNMFFGGSQCVRIKDNVPPEAASDPRRDGFAQTLVM